MLTGCLYRRACGLSWLAWSKGWLPPGAMLYLSREPSELSQWLCYDERTINIVVVIITIIITVISVSVVSQCKLIFG